MKLKYFCLILCVLLCLSSFGCTKKDSVVDNSQKEISEESTQKNEEDKPEDKEDKEDKDVVDVKTGENADDYEMEQIEDILDERFFIEEEIILKSPEDCIFAIVDNITDDEATYFTITDTYEVFENDEEYENVIILPTRDWVYIVGEIIEYNSEKNEFVVIEEFPERFVDLFCSNLIKVPMKETIPNFRIKVIAGDEEIYWYNTYDGLNGNGIHFYNDSGESEFIDWNPEELLMDDISRGYNTLVEYEDVAHYLDLGMSIMHTDELVDIDGISCILYVVGTNREDQFVTERHYAYDPIYGTVYYFDVELNEWFELGRG